MTAWHHRLEGIIILLTLIAVLIGLVGHWVPDTIPGVALNLRILDNFRPQLLGVALGGAGLLALRKMRRLAATIALLSLAGGALIVVDYRTRLAPSAPTGAATLEVLWVNLLQSNTVSPDRLSAELLGSGADLIVLAEATPAFDAIPGLSDLYPYRAGCSTPARCELLILSRRPLGPITFGDTAFGQQRMARFPIYMPDGTAVMVVAVHRIKPWYLGLTNMGDEWMNAVLSGRRDRSMIVMGDFNATPWSRRMSYLADTHGLRSFTRPVATWPAQAGPFGLAIDHVLTRGGAQIRSLTSWGGNLGSNHVGLRASVAIWDITTTGPTEGD